MFQFFSPKYHHIFFDLDHTLWDFEKNSETTLLELHAKYPLLSMQFPTGEEFLSIYRKYNTILWSEYHRGNITKDSLRHQRFYRTLKSKSIDNHNLADKLDEEYIAESPKKTALMPHALETLEYLKTQNYHLHIITNGFNEVQFEKLRCSKLDTFFDTVTTSENACCQKPHARIFEYAAKPLQTQNRYCVMIGDNFETDIEGAKNFGWDQIFYNPQEESASFKPTKEIKDLEELRSFL